MARLFIPLLLVLALVWWWRSRRAVPPPSKKEDPPVNKVSVTLPMVACRHCGTHIAEHEARQHQGQWYCSLSHQEAGTKD